VVGNYLINYLATRGPLPHFVNASLILLLCRVTKFGWFDDDRFREVVKEATDFLSQVGCFLCCAFLRVISCPRVSWILKVSYMVIIIIFL
jgi:hypothetical protein